MTALGEKLKASLYEAIAIARGDCEHDWKRIKPSLSPDRLSFECKVCRVKVHLPKGGPNILGIPLDNKEEE